MAFQEIIRKSFKSTYLMLLKIEKEEKGKS